MLGIAYPPIERLEQGRQRVLSTEVRRLDRGNFERESVVSGLLCSGGMVAGWVDGEMGSSDEGSRSESP